MMFISIFYKCFTLVVLLSFCDLCVCSRDYEKRFIPGSGKAASRRGVYSRYQPEDGQGGADMSSESEMGVIPLDEDETPHLNYYYPSIGNKIGPMAAPYIRTKRHGETDYPGYEMKLHLQKREATSFEDETREPVFQVKHVVQSPVAIDADGLYIDEPESESQDELEGTRGSGFNRRRRRTQKLGNDLGAVAADEGSSSFIHYQIENLKAKVKRDFEQSRKINKRSRLLKERREHKAKNKKRKTAEARLSLKVKREFVPSASRPKRLLQAVKIDLAQFQELDRNDALRTNVKRMLKHTKSFNRARVKKLAPPLAHNKAQSSSPMRKRNYVDKFPVRKTENDIHSRSDEELTHEKSIREPAIKAQDEWKMSENDVPSSDLDKAKKKRNVSGLVINRSLFDDDEFAPASDYNFENAMRRRRRQAGKYLAENNLRENNAFVKFGKGFLSKRGNYGTRNEFSKDVIQKNEADIQKMKQELDTLFKTINLSMAKNINPTSDSETAWKKYSNNQMAADENDIDRDNAGENSYMEVENDSAPEYTLDNNEEKAPAMHRALEPSDDSLEHAVGDASVSSKGAYSSPKAKCQSSLKGGAEEDDGDDLEREAQYMVNRRQMGSRSFDHRVRNFMISPSYLRAPRRRLLSLNEEASIAENNHDSLVSETKRNSGTGFYSVIPSNAQDELQEDNILSGGDKGIGKSETIKESDDSHAGACQKNERKSADGEADAAASGSDKQWLEKKSRPDISYGSDNENNVSVSSQEADIKDKRQVNAKVDKTPVMESSKTAVQNTTINQRDTNHDSDTKRIDPRSSDKFKAVDQELEEHNQRAIEFRNMDVKLGPQVAEVAKLIEQSHQKELNKERTQISGDNTLVSLTHTDNDHSVRKKAENDATSAALTEQRKKRSSHHHGSNHSSVDEKVETFPVDSYADLTGDLDLDLKKYFTGVGKNSHRAFHGKNKVNYKPVVDWQEGDRERFAQLQAHRKLNEAGFEDNQITDTVTSSDNSNENYNDKVIGLEELNNLNNKVIGLEELNNLNNKVMGLEELNNLKFSGGKTKLGEFRGLRSDTPSRTSFSEESIKPKKSHGLNLKNTRQNLMQRRKLFELLRLSKSKLNPESSARDDAEASHGGGASWLERLIKNQTDEIQKKANAMESKSVLKRAYKNVGLKDKSDYNTNERRDESHNQVKKNIATTKVSAAADECKVVSKRHPQVRRAEWYGPAGGAEKRQHRRQQYVVKKRDLGADLNDDDDGPGGRVYYERQFRDNNFHRRNVPSYGLPSPDLFSKWDTVDDVHGFSKNLFNNLQSSPDEEIVAGFDNEGNYISPIALDRVKRMRRQTRRRRGVPNGHEERRRRRRRRRTFLFPKADPVEDFFAARPGRVARVLQREQDEEDEGEAMPRAVRLRERRQTEQRDEEGWPVMTRSCAVSQLPSTVALVALSLGYYTL